MYTQKNAQKKWSQVQKAIMNRRQYQITNSNYTIIIIKNRYS